MKFYDLIFQVERELIALRRQFHENAELSMREYSTSKLVQDKLEEYGIPFEIVGECGVVGKLECGCGGKIVMLRADMDALPMEEGEENFKQKKTCISKKKGISHTCGHDAHTAMLIASAKVLSHMKDKLCGTILFCFEQGEEIGGGIDPIIKYLSDYNIDAAWGIHVNSMMKSGVISVNAGPRTAGGMVLDVEITGKGAHGAFPQSAHDPLLCAADAIVSFNAICAREIPPQAAATITIGSFNSGTVGNIIPEKANFKGTVRFFEDKVGDAIYDGVQRVLKSTCEKHRCSFELHNFFRCNPVNNDKALSLLAENAMKKHFSEESVQRIEPLMGSETFAQVSARYPSVFAILGTGNEQEGSFGTMMHNPMFDLDENALKNGVTATVQFALDVLSK